MPSDNYIKFYKESEKSDLVFGGSNRCASHGEVRCSCREFGNGLPAIKEIIDDRILEASY
jgi:hypothetical protein